MVNGSQYFYQLCKHVVLSAWLLHSAVESISAVPEAMYDVKPRVEYYVFESNHVSKFKEKDFKRFPSDLTQKLFTLNLTRDPLEFTKKPGGPKIIPTIFLTADSKTENNPDNIFDN